MSYIRLKLSNHNYSLSDNSHNHPIHRAHHINETNEYALLFTDPYQTTNPRCFYRDYSTPFLSPHHKIQSLKSITNINQLLPPIHARIVIHVRIVIKRINGEYVEIYTKKSGIDLSRA